MSDPVCTACGTQGLPCCGAPDDPICRDSICDTTNGVCKNPGTVGYGQVCVPGNAKPCSMDSLACNATDYDPPLCMCAPGKETQSCGAGLVCADDGPAAPTAGGGYPAAPSGTGPPSQYPTCKELAADGLHFNMDGCRTDETTYGMCASLTKDTNSACQSSTNPDTKNEPSTWNCIPGETDTCTGHLG